MLKKLMRVINSKHKGQIALFVSIFSMLMVFVVFSLLPSTDYKLSYVSSYSNHVLCSDGTEKKRELFLTDFNNYLMENYKGESNEELAAFMTANKKFLFEDLAIQNDVDITYIDEDPRFKVKIDNKTIYVQPAIYSDEGEDKVKYIIKKESEVLDVQKDK